MKQPEGLIGVLLDSAAEFGDRDDAAMDLSEFDNQSVIDALQKVIDSKESDEDLVERCKESLNEMLLRRKGK